CLRLGPLQVDICDEAHIEVGERGQVLEVLIADDPGADHADADATAAHASPLEERKAKLSATAWKRSPRESSSSITRSASGAAAMICSIGSEPWPTAT